MPFNRVRDNLHVVLAMSPIGESFRNRTRMYPGLVNCTTIDWFQQWPADALVEVATKFIQDIPVRREGGGGGEGGDTMVKTLLLHLRGSPNQLTFLI